MACGQGAQGKRIKCEIEIIILSYHKINVIPKLKLIVSFFISKFLLEQKGSLYKGILSALFSAWLNRKKRLGQF